MKYTLKNILMLIESAIYFNQLEEVTKYGNKNRGYHNYES